ncbi:MAG: hypothetical protein AAF572_07260 [Cyanobacteria bacterium P01_B01_bin.77]
MTSQKDQIQRLIAEIEATLAKPASRLPLGLSGDAGQRQLLDKLSDYLQSLEQMFESPGGWGPLDPNTGRLVSPSPTAPDIEESAAQVLQGVLLEMRYLRENSLKPMRQELESLQQKRESLQAEINVLEAQRGADPLQSEEQISAFLETLMQRLQEQLSAQMVQNFAAMEAAAAEQLAVADTPSPLLSGQRLEQVRLLQAQSDQLLLKLDTTLTAVFGSLQKSVDSYRESLEEGLDQMHGLGRQGEVIFHAFINHLAQQLGQDASSYLAGEIDAQSALHEPDPGTTDVDLEAVQLNELDQALENLALEEEIGDDAADPAVAIDLDLNLLENIGALSEEGDALAEDITVIQPDDADPDIELALLEDAIASSDIDDDITLIQADDRNLDLGLNIDLDEDITVIQPDDAAPDLSMLENAISFSDIAPETAVPNDDDALVSENPTPFDGDISIDTLDAPDALDTPDEPSVSFSLNSALENSDENFGLLAMGADSGDLLSFESEAAASQGGLPQVESEGDLFNLDTGFDLTPTSEPEQDPAGMLAEDMLPDTPSDSGQISDDLLAFSFANEGDITETSSETLPLANDIDEQISEQSAETELIDADQIADDWLFDMESADDGEAIPSPNLESDIHGDLSPEPTVENLFGDSIPTPVESSDGGDTIITSLVDLMPDEPSSETVEDFSDNVSDDVYIAASVDEDLINLVEPGTEQHLLIDFDDRQLVEQLDEDLQKLASETFSADYDIEEDDALEPLDQDTLETIVRDLNLEDLDLEHDSESDPMSSETTSTESDAEESDAEENQDPSANEDEDFQSITADNQDTGLDLFDGFATDTVDLIDDPSANETDELAVITSEVVAMPEALDLDSLGLGADIPGDEFDDGLPDSLADELVALNEHSKTLSREPNDDVVGQLLSDLEEPVIGDDEMLSVPAVEEAAPHLESASMPDLPLDFLADELTTEPPASDDFLEAEQQAFWQTVTDDETKEAPAAQQLPENNLSFGSDPLQTDEFVVSETILEEPEESEKPDDEPETDRPDMGIPDADLDDLLSLDDQPLPSDIPVSENKLDLEPLDELFGQSSLSELDAVLEGDTPIDSLAAATSGTTDPLTELGLGMSVSPELLVPDVEDAPDVPGTLPSEAVEADSLIDDLDTTEAITPTPPVIVPPIDVAPVVDLEGDWFLGLDVGTTGLSAVLMNRRTGQVYPLYWQTSPEDAKHFRLPAMAVMTASQETVAVGYDALGDLEDLLDAFGSQMPELIGVNRLKPLLKVAVGHGQTLATSDPWLRWSDTVELPMLQVLQAMVALLKYLVDQGQAVGLEGDNLAQVWEKLQGVIVGYPTNWPDTYSFNLREALLAAGLIHQPEQILFVEDAIATVLSGLPDPSNVAISETVSLSRQPSLYNCQWQDGTVVISGGAVMTELGLVNLPKDLASLDYADFALRSFAYAGDALDQDIVCQLLLPDERRQPLSAADASTHWDWQGHLSTEDTDWGQLNLDDLTLPAVGHIDWGQRYRLQHRLLGSNLGQSLLAAARHLKLALQQQNQVQITLAGQRWLIKRRHLENLIFLPYIQRINRYLNVLLSHHTVDAQAIKQVICTGGSASLPAIARWLRQKFPNATIIQDTYASELPQSCSRVAYGLVNLARYAQVLNVTRQQYSDYFLLMELLRVFPQQPLPVGAIMHLLEQRGINTQACHLHILALLEGHLPPGLVPTAADRGLICDRTADLPTYRALLKTPLFRKTVTESGGHIYIPNEAQAEQLRAYFNRLLIDKTQTLEEPLIAQLEVLV